MKQGQSLEQNLRVEVIRFEIWMNGVVTPCFSLIQKIEQFAAQERCTCKTHLVELLLRLLLLFVCFFVLQNQTIFGDVVWLYNHDRGECYSGIFC